MRHETKKVCRIVDELTTFFLKEDTNEVDIKIKKDSDKVVLNIIDHDTHFDDEYIDKLREIFSTQRQCEIEEYYWQLAGETDWNEELSLVSALIDEAIVEKKDGNLCVKLIRYIGKR